MARAQNLAARAVAWEHKSEAPRRRLDAAFFDEALGSCVLALDRDKKLCRILASNAGRALLAGIAFPERARREENA